MLPSDGASWSIPRRIPSICCCWKHTGTEEWRMRSKQWGFGDAIFCRRQWYSYFCCFYCKNAYQIAGKRKTLCLLAHPIVIMICFRCEFSKLFTVDNVIVIVDCGEKVQKIVRCRHADCGHWCAAQKKCRARKKKWFHYCLIPRI